MLQRTLFALTLSLAACSAQAPDQPVDDTPPGPFKGIIYWLGPCASAEEDKDRTCNQGLHDTCRLKGQRGEFMKAVPVPPGLYFNSTGSPQQWSWQYRCVDPSNH